MDSDMLQEFERLKILEKNLKEQRERSKESTLRSKARPDYKELVKKYNKDYYQKKRLKEKNLKETLF